MDMDGTNPTRTVAFWRWEYSTDQYRAKTHKLLRILAQVMARLDFIAVVNSRNVKLNLVLTWDV